MAATGLPYLLRAWAAARVMGMRWVALGWRLGGVWVGMMALRLRWWGFAWYNSHKKELYWAVKISHCAQCRVCIDSREKGLPL